MPHKPQKVNSLASGDLITGTGKDGGEPLTVARAGVSPGQLVGKLRDKANKAVVFEPTESFSLRGEFAALAAALLEVHPGQIKFSIRLEGFPRESAYRSLHAGVAALLPGREVPSVRTIAEDITRTWKLLRNHALVDETTHATFNFEAGAGGGKPYHKDTKHRPDNAVLAMRWFGGKPVAGLALAGEFSRVGEGGKAYLHDIEECFIPDAGLVVFKPEEVIHGILPVEKGTRWSYTITTCLKP